MINGKTEQFLDTGWFSESTLFYNGYIYWCEAQRSSDDGCINFFFFRWKDQNESNTYYHSCLEKDGTLSWKIIFDIEGTDIDELKKRFLTSPIFEGKNFWEVENELAWLEEGSPIIQ